MTFLFFYWVELTFGGEEVMGRFLTGGGGLSPCPSSENPVYIYIFFLFIYIYIHICCTCYTYTYIKELCQQVFIYNEEDPYTSDKSCAKVAILRL